MRAACAGGAPCASSSLSSCCPPCCQGIFISTVHHHHHCSITVPSLYHHCAITVPSRYHHGTITIPSRYHHRTITVLSPYHYSTIMVPAPSHHCTILVPSLHHHDPCTCSLLLQAASGPEGARECRSSFDTLWCRERPKIKYRRLMRSIRSISGDPAPSQVCVLVTSARLFSHEVASLEPAGARGGSQRLWSGALVRRARTCPQCYAYLVGRYLRPNMLMINIGCFLHLRLHTCTSSTATNNIRCHHTPLIITSRSA